MSLSGSQISDLATEINDNSLAVFAGAGVAAHCGKPTWEHALNRLADEIERRGKTSEAVLIREKVERHEYLQAANVFGIARNELTRDDNKQILDTVFGEEVTPNEDVQALVRLPVNVFVTTNYDRVLEDAYSDVRSKSLDTYVNTSHALREAQQPDRPSIVYIHGRLNKPETVVLTQEDYERTLTDKQYTNLLRQLLRDYVVLFVGFSFHDPALKLVLRKINESLPATPANKSYAFVPDASGELISDLTSMGISPLEYSDDNNHEELWTAIRMLVREASTESGVTVSRAPDEDLVRENLAASYTHLIAQAKHPSAVTAARAGVVHGAIEKLTGGGEFTCTVPEVRQRLQGILKYTDDEAGVTIEDGLRLLNTNEWIDSTNDTITLLKSPEGDFYEALSDLSSSLKDRTLARSKSRVRAEPDKLQGYILQILLIHGMTVGRAVIRGRPIQEPKLQDVIEQCYNDVFGYQSPPWRKPLLRATKTLFMNPTEEEDEQLTSIARTIFITDVIVTSPTIDHIVGVPDLDSAVLDANVLLPSSLRHHPHSQLYEDLFADMRRIDLDLLTTTGFVEEMVTHTESVTERVRELSLDDEERVVEYVRMSDMYQVSDIIHGFAHAIHGGWVQGYDEYLRKEVPFTDEEEATDYVRERGIEVVDLASTEGFDRGRSQRYKGALKDVYGNADEPTVRHEGNLVEYLVNRIEGGVPRWLVTNHRGLIRGLEVLSEQDSSVPSQINRLTVTPVRALALLDVVSEAVDWKGYSRLLVNAGHPSLYDQAEEYLIDRFLRRFDTMSGRSIRELVGKVQNELGGEIRRIESRGGTMRQQRDRLVKRLDQIDEAVYEAVASEVREDESSGATENSG